MSRRGGRFFGWASAITTLAAFLIPQTSRADEPPSAASERPLRSSRAEANDMRDADGVREFRRIYVPEKQLPTMARGYLPIKRDEFERLLRAAKRNVVKASAPTTRASLAEYSARFEGDALTAGQGAIEIAHENQSPGWLALSDTTLPIHNAVWQDRPELPAPLGLNSDDQLVLLVAAPGNLRFQWSLQGKRLTGDGYEFELRLPPAALNRLRLAVPRGFVVTSSQGIVSKQVVTEKNNESKNTKAAERRAGLSDQDWLLELGGHTQATLRIAPESPPPSKIATTVFRQFDQYEISPAEIHLHSELRVDVGSQPLPEIVLDIPHGMRVTHATLDEKSLTWEVLAHSEATQEQTVIRFATPLTGANSLLRVHAVAVPQLNEQLTLPTIRPRNLRWSEGTAVLAIRETLVASQLTAVQGRHTQVSRLAGSGYERHQFQFFSENHALQLLLERRTPRLRLAAGTTVNVDVATIAAHMLVDIQADAGAVYELDADVPAEWVVDDVVTIPSDHLDDYDVAPLAGKSLQRLRIRLKHPVTPQRSVRLSLRAHRRRPAETVLLGIDQLRLADFQGLTHKNRVIALNTETNLHPEVSGEFGVERLDPQKLARTDAELLAARADSLIVRDDDVATRLKVRFRTGQPEFVAHVAIDCRFAARGLSEEYRFDIRPERSPVGKLLVHFSPPRDEPFVWTLEGPAQPALTARRLTPDEQKKQGVANGELWELTLRTPRSSRFNLSATRTSTFAPAPADATTPISLASIPLASSQTGSVVVTAKGVAIALQTEGMRPIPLKSSSRAEIDSRIAALRFDPGQKNLLAVQRLHERDDTVANGADVWAWSCDIDTRLSASGTQSNTALYRLENVSASQVVFQIPPDVRIEQVRVLDSEIPLLIDDQQLEVPLPADDRFPTVLVRYSNTVTMPSWSGNISPVTPGPTFPVLGGQWTLWTSPDVDVATATEQPRNLLASTWQNRLLGSFWRGANVPAANWSLSFTAGGSTTDSAATTELALENLGLALRERPKTNSEESRPATWSHLLSEWNRRLNRDDTSKPAEDPASKATLAAAAPAAKTPTARLLLIDAAGLAEVDIFAATELDSVDNETELSSLLLGQHWLRIHGLALLATDKHLVLTTAARLATLSGETELTLRPVAAVARSLTVGAASTVQLLLDQSCPADAWPRTAIVHELPWPRSPDRISADLAYSGWQARQLPLSGTQAAELRVFRTGELQLLGVWGLAVAALVVLSLPANRLGRNRLLVIVTLAVAVLLSPVAFVPLLRGFLWGGLLGCLLRQVRTKLPLVAKPTAMPPRSTVTRLVITGGSRCLLFAMTIAVVAPAKPRGVVAVEPTSPAARKMIETVLLPLDSNNQPTADYVYLTHDFYQSLRKQAAAQTNSQRGWLLLSALYNGVTSAPSPTDPGGIAEITASLELEIFEPGTIWLPFDKQQWNLLNDRASLDGQPISVDWDSEGRGLFFDVTDTGTSRLELAFRPIVRTFDAMLGFDAKIPRLTNSKLRLHLSNDEQRFTVLSTFGGSETSRTTATLVAELGPVSLLSLRWPAQAGRTETSRTATVDQLQWLRVRPGSVVLDTHLHVSPPTGKKLQQITLQVDPRLTLLPLVDSASQLIAEVREGDVGSVRLTLRDATTVPISLPLSFLLSGASGVGRLSWPKLQVADCHVTRNWGALSVMPPLQLEPLTTTPNDTADTAEFITAWGDADNPPNTVLQLNAKTEDLTLAVQPVRARLSGRSTTDVIVRRKRLEIRFTADMRLVDGQLFQQTVACPPGFVAREVSVLAADSERLMRWSQRPDGTLNILLNQAVTGEHTLFVRGDLPLAASGQTDVRPLRPIADDFAEREISIYRLEETQVTVTPLAGWDLAKEIEVGGYFDGLGRLVSRLQPRAQTSPGTASFAKVKVVETRPNVQGRIHTVLRHADPWEVTVDARLQVDRGSLETLRFEIPSDWAGPFTIEPAADFSVTSIPGQSRQHLSIRPQQALSGKCELKIRGALAAGANEAVPEILPLDMQKVEMFVVVPTQVRAQKIDWETSLLQAAPMPEELATDQSLADFAAFRVAGTRFRAIIRQVEQPQGTPSVVMADYAVLAQRGGGFTVHATIDIDPAGKRECVLQLPAGCQLVRLYRDGHSPTLRQVADQRWEVPLGPEQLIQRLELLYSGNSPNTSVAAETAGIPVPAIVDWPVRQSIWTLRDERHDVVRDTPEVSLVHAIQNDLLRLRKLQEIVQQRNLRVGTHTSAEISDWLALWLPRIQEIRQRLERNLASPLLSADHPAFRDLQKQAEQVFATLPATSSNDDSRERWSLGPDSWKDVATGPFRTEFGKLNTTLTFVPHFHRSLPTVDLPVRMLVSLAVVAIGLFMAQSRVRSRLTTLIDRHGFWLLLLAAACAWLWLQPNWLAPALVLTAFFWLSVTRRSAVAAK